MSDAETNTNVVEQIDVHGDLARLPGLIYRKTEEVVDAEKGVKQLKHVVDLKEAAIKAERSGEKLTATSLNAIAYTQTGELRSDLMDLESTLELRKAQLQYLRDRFDSVRKEANLRIEEMRRLDGVVTNRYGDRNGNRNN